MSSLMDRTYESMRMLQIQHIHDCLSQEGRYERVRARQREWPRLRRSQFKVMYDDEKPVQSHNLVTGDRRAKYLIRGVEKDGTQREYMLEIGLAPLNLSGETRGRSYCLRDTRTGRGIMGKPDELTMCVRRAGSLELDLTMGKLEESSEDGSVAYLAVPTMNNGRVRYNALAIEDIRVYRPARSNAKDWRAQIAPQLPRDRRANSTYANAA